MLWDYHEDGLYLFDQHEYLFLFYICELGDVQGAMVILEQWCHLNWSFGMAVIVSFLDKFPDIVPIPKVKTFPKAVPNLVSENTALNLKLNLPLIGHILLLKPGKINLKFIFLALFQILNEQWQLRRVRLVMF